MEEERQHTYLTLINALLTCPSGEEGQILEDNAEFVDAGLVETMAQVAEALVRSQILSGALMKCNAPCIVRSHLYLSF